jgi:aryl-alcohol dehydrogenase-like predicted oxidoreductase
MFAQLDALRDILTRDGWTLGQGALGWIWGCSPRTIPIPSFTTAAQVEENVSTLRFGPLSKERMQEINALFGR